MNLTLNSMKSQTATVCVSCENFYLRCIIIGLSFDCFFACYSSKQARKLHFKVVLQLLNGIIIIDVVSSRISRFLLPHAKWNATKECLIKN